MQYGHFDDAAREYVVDRPDTPRAWSNYLGSTEYGAIVTNNAGGYSFYRSAALGRFLRFRTNAIPMDQPGRYLYLRDRASGDYWSASWQPVGKPLETYKSVCRHGTAYTIIESQYAGIRSEATYFVPLGQKFEYWRLRVTNETDRPRDLSLFTYCEFAGNWALGQDTVNIQYTAYTVKCDWVEGMLRVACNDNVPADPEHFTNGDQGRWTWMALTGADVTAYDSDRELFIGPYRTYANPLVVEQGRMSNSLAMGDNACGGQQADLTLAPGETREILVMLGVGKAEVEGVSARAEFGTAERAEKELQKLRAEWHSRLGKLTCQTPDPAFNSMINVWNAYNCLLTFAWSRAASLIYGGDRDGLAYRDTVQDFVGVTPTIPEMVRERMELMITGQNSTGGAMPLVRPFAHEPGKMPPTPEHSYRSDDCLWLFNAVPAYVTEVGDLAFYDKVLPYSDKGSATVLGHLRRALEFNLERRGAHGLPSGLDADWNDCLRLGPKGESLFVTFQVRLGLTVYADIVKRLGRETEATWAAAQLADLDRRIQAHAWDGEWFVRGYRENGTPLGSKSEAEGTIFINAQSWAVISGAATPDQAERAMESAHERLATEYGLMICAPPYAKTPYHIVRAVLMNGGMKENGGIFSQPQGWAVMAETLLGHGDRAFEYYRAFMPAAQNDKAEIRQIEPYVHCQSTHSPFSRRYGASRIPWLTGTAAWAYFSATQHILGLRPEMEGLRLDPCVPAAWKEFSMTRLFRGKQIHIRVENPNGVQKGVVKTILNGTELKDNLLPAEALKEANDVVVTMG